MKRQYARRGGLAKRCGCPKRRWNDCPHPWHLNYRGERVSLDEEAGEHIASKRDAEMVANTIRTQIDADTFVPRRKRRLMASVPISVNATMTVRQLGELFFAQATNKWTGKPLSQNERYKWDLFVNATITRTNGVQVTLGDLPIKGEGALDRHDLETWRVEYAKPHRVTIRDKRGRTYEREIGGQVSVNRCRGRAVSVFNWALLNDHVDQTPFRKGHINAVPKYGERKRDRRLRPGEDDNLLKAMADDPSLLAIYICARELAVRKEELLTLQWWQVDWDQNVIRLQSEDTKDAEPRGLTMPQKVRALLEMRRTGADGASHPPTGFVFGHTATGERRKDIKKAWTTKRLRMAGFTGPIWLKGGRINPEASAALKALNLKFHDIRREAASSLAEHGMDLLYVSQYLGHADVKQTSTYLKTTPKGMRAQMAAVEKAKAKRRKRPEFFTNFHTEQPVPEKSGAGKARKSSEIN